MCTQYKKISSITIDDHIKKEITKYSISSPPKSQNPRLNTITITSKKKENKIYFYTYENEENVNIAKEGLSDLINTAPVTLCTQYKKISSITIEDHINKEITKYSISSPPKSQIHA